MQLKNKVAFITGATGGIAENIALSLAEEGVNLILQYRSNEAKAKAIASQTKGSILQTDLSTASQVSEALKNVWSVYGRLDILINCIGDFHFSPLSELKPETFSQIINSNLQIAYNLCHFALPYLKESSESRILNLGYATASQIEPKPNILPYHISKMGLILLTKAFAHTEASHKVLINCLSPAIVENTDYWPKTQIPLQRPAKLSEISNAALFLLKSDYITGFNLEIDGGWRGLN